MTKQSIKAPGPVVDVSYTNGIATRITRPTRLSHNAATLVDHFCVSADACLNMSSKVLTSDISDRGMTFS